MEVKNPVLAVVGAVAVHALLALAIVLYLGYAPGPTVSAELDLSSVELSFADEAAEAESVAPTLPESTPLQPKPQSERPPEAQPEKPLPPDPSDYKFPEPKETPSPLSPPPPSTPPSPPSQLSQARLDAPPRPKRAIKPEYPKGARQRGEQGNVVLEIEVGADGACAAAKVVGSSGFAELDAAALKAVRAARFTPAKAEGRPVASIARLTLTFRLK